MSTWPYNKRNNIFNTLTSVLFIMALLYSGLAHSGAWTGPKGATYNKFGLNYFTSDKQLNGQGDSVAAGSEFTDINFTYYGEYGIADNMSVFGSIPLKNLESEPSGGASVDNSGIGDIDVGLRYKLLDEDWGLLSVQGLVKIPEAYDEKDTLPLGNGQYDVEVRLLYGRSLYPKPMYVGAEFGYRARAEAPSDDIKYLLEFGYTASDKVSLRAKLDGSVSAKTDDPASSTAVNPTLAPDFDLGKLDLTASYTIKKDVYLEFSWAPVVYGRSTADGSTLSLALIYAFQPAK